MREERSPTQPPSSDKQAPGLHSPTPTPLTYRNSCALTHELPRPGKILQDIFKKSHVLPNLLKLNWRTSWLKNHQIIEILSVGII